MTPDVTYVVLLNWRGWRDTIACLDSVFASREARYRVIVCDNESGDGSLDRIEDWARGRLPADVPEHERLARFVGTESARPSWTRIERAQAENPDYRVTTSLVLVENGGNLGFAAGNNVGLRLALAQQDMGSVWLLNNDTVVEPHCLAAMRETLARRGGRAAVGSVIHFFDCPEVIQAFGGNRFNRVSGVAACSEGRYLHESKLQTLGAVASQLDYLSGCSMLLPREFLEEVGLMCEDYFLYYEEIDWFTRAAGRFEICVAEGARLYHREGGAIGSPAWQRPASRLSDYYMQRSRLAFMRKYHTASLPWCYLVGVLDLGKRLVRGQVLNARAIAAALLGRPLRGVSR